LVRGAADDEREGTEDEICREKDEEATSCSESDGIVDSPKEVTERKKEKEDRGVEEDRDGLDHLSHLKLGQALEEISAHAATLLGFVTELGILQVLSRPLLDERGHECARQAKEETYEHEDVDADGHSRWLEGLHASGGVRRGTAVRLGLRNQLSQECYCDGASIREEQLVRFDDERRNDSREQARLFERRVNDFNAGFPSLDDMAHLQISTWRRFVPSMSQRAPCRICQPYYRITSRPWRTPSRIHVLR